MIIGSTQSSLNAFMEMVSWDPTALIGGHYWAFHQPHESVHKTFVFVISVFFFRICPFFLGIPFFSGKPFLVWKWVCEWGGVSVWVVWDDEGRGPFFVMQLFLSCLFLNGPFFCLCTKKFVRFKMRSTNTEIGGSCYVSCYQFSIENLLSQQSLDNFGWFKIPKEVWGRKKVLIPKL